MPRVKVVAETGEAKTVEFEADLYIGRDRSNDVVLADPSCSRHHALIRRQGDRYAVVDLGSNNGVVVNGRRVAQQVLHSGDRIQLGHLTLVYEEGAPTQAVEIEIDDLNVRASSICTRPEPGKRLQDLYDILRAISGCAGTRETLQALCDRLRAALQ